MTVGVVGHEPVVRGHGEFGVDVTMAVVGINRAVSVEVIVQSAS